jgi:hypothetical protein
MPVGAAERDSLVAGSFSLGNRVEIVGRDTPYSGEQGVVTNSPGKVFNGWTIKLDSGPVIGVDRRYLRLVKS